ncbi:MAG: glutathione S-transferase family protein [Paracoccaceae bacterium]
MSDVVLYDFPGSICSQMARLALAEKGVTYRRQTVDIMKTNEQFEPWYIALNPKSVVPTLRIGDEIITDTITIVKRVDRSFSGPGLTPANTRLMDEQMHDIMGLHYGVLLYSGGLTAGRTSPTIIARGEFLRKMLQQRPEHAALLQKRIDGNLAMQAILADPDRVDAHFEEARSLVEALDKALAGTEFVAADHYSLADCFATAALARLHMHGFAHWWQGDNNPKVARYLAAMRGRDSWAAAAVVDRAENAT